jgi:asparagine synthase (glutamine-hydrolysing)
VASELKALEGYCTKIQLFPPGHYIRRKTGNLYNGKREWTEFDAVKDNETSIADIKVALEAVHRQLMSDVPYGVLLSGGLDSSITRLLPKYAQNVLSQGIQSMPGIHCILFSRTEGSP